MSIEHPEQHEVTPDQLPPLEATAEVPMQHRDDVNTPEYLREKFDAPSAVVPPEHRDDRHAGSGPGKRIIAGVAGGALLLAGAFVGAKVFGGHDSDKPGRTQSTSAPKTPGSNKPSTPAETAPAPKTLEDYVVTKQDNETPDFAAQSLIDLESTYANAPTADPIIMEAILTKDPSQSIEMERLSGQLEEIRQDVVYEKNRLKVGNNKDGTYKARFLPETASTVFHPKPGVAYPIMGTMYYETNFDEPPYYDMDFDYEQRYEITVAYDEAGNWHITDQVPKSDRIPNAE